MKIITHLNSISKRSVDVQTFAKDDNLQCEKHDIRQRLNTYARVNRNPGQQPSSCIEENSESLTNIEERITEKQPIEKSSAESIDNESQSAHIDEEREAMRVETTRFF